ncbi:hypothetical protein FGF66_01110 [Chlorobaculum thiosulfatiphilum]|uniref:Uncharacterized protein n=1 Tax=Chlorobaculum thiosulfatiphilum TaxID=115852 RepID=A0A5C4SC84_CHLTI|nr:hypothetical protein FGF66_01110 [Chlorobaculum thiosulfatiphilum]
MKEFTVCRVCVIRYRGRKSHWNGPLLPALSVFPEIGAEKAKLLPAWTAKGTMDVKLFPCRPNEENAKLVSSNHHNKR